MAALFFYIIQRRLVVIDKVVLKFLADVLYVKEELSFEEYEAIMDAKTPFDLDDIVDKMLNDEFRVLLRGETYGRYPKKR